MNLYLFYSLFYYEFLKASIVTKLESVNIQLCVIRIIILSPTIKTSNCLNF